MKPKPCLHIAGEKDRLVLFANQQRSMEQLRKLNHCEAEGTPWVKESAGSVILYPSPEKTPFVAAIFPGGHEVPKEGPELIVKFFRFCDVASASAGTDKVR